MGQERYPQGATLEWRSWYPSRGPDALGPWDHNHCAFCTVHLADHVLDDDPDTQLAGYTTPDGLYWICRDCFEDFQNGFGWVVTGEPPT